MKKFFWLFIVPLLIAGSSCQKTLDPEKEKEVLIALNEEERDAYFAHDLARLENVWKQLPTSRRVFSTASGITELYGWDEIRANYDEDINDAEKWERMADVAASFSNYDVQLAGKTALMYHDIHWTGTYGGGPLDMKQKRIVHCVKQGGAWKFDMTVQMTVPDENVAENKRTSALYHELKPENVDLILTEDFIGRAEKDRHTWDRESHRNYLSNGVYKRDSIFQQVAEGNWVATRFFREMDYQGKRVKVEAMHFKRFEDGKIAEIWEYADSGQLE
jgi:hypothetical protein